MTLHEIRRVRHELRRRTLTVTGVTPLTPKMLRIHLTGDLTGFDSAGFDDHVKLLLGTPGAGPGEPGAPGEGPRPPMRDYTPRLFDVAAGTLAIDFALHDAGPATAWAMNAAPGDRIGIGGPRGSAIVPDDFDWYLMVGDETALPAIGRRLSELRADVPVTVIAAVTGPDEEQSFETRANLTMIWVHRGEDRSNDPAPVLAAIADVPFPPGDGFVWIAAEASVARAARALIVDTRGHPLAWTKASGYWQHGQADVSDKLM
ncbi:MAG TPA: siderophore-interacting protein [Sphingomonas sp.]|jgi:NADPH-dependent ferric siderophore reductase|uniref:siderophore-interacting protein n=1 Tax=Sphingomonas sp. TaxID=28214 RepID=UPI002EDB8585